MKKTKLKRVKGLKRTNSIARKPLGGGKVGLRKTRLKTRGRRKEREADAEKAFREEGVAWLRYCKICLPDAEALARDRNSGNSIETQRVEAHHLCPRSRGAGHPRLHDIRNREWLCRIHHDEVHRGLHPHLIRSRDFLDTLETTA